MFSWECTNSLKQQKQPPKVFRKKGVLKNFAIFTRKHLCWSLFSVFGVNFIKKRLQHRHFPMNITKFLGTPILKNTWERQSTFTWEAKWTQTGMRFHLGWKSHLGVESALYMYSLELSRNETQNGTDFISVILTEMKFKTGMRVSCEHNFPKTKWISADS